MFGGEGGKSPLQEAAIEIGIVGDNEHYPVEQIVDSVIVDAATGDHRIANAGDLRDLGWDRNARICAPIPGAENLIDPPALPFILNVCDEYGGGQDAHPIFVYPWRRSVADRR